MDDEHQLDLTSEPPIAPAADAQRSPSKRNNPRPSLRVFFACCRVYANVVIPTGVLDSRLTSLRMHCPRCARLEEIRLD
ncbi:MAG: hypothetical protein R3C53_22445 [Pirellulaceae bacterium]